MHLFLIRSSLVLTLLAGSWGYADEPTGSPDLRGVWVLVGGVSNGTAIPREEAQKVKVTFTKNRMILSSTDIETDLPFTFTADSKKNPGWMDVTPVEGPFKGQKHRSIYELKQGQLKLCIPKRPVPERPTKFESPKGSLLHVFALKRLE